MYTVIPQHFLHNILATRVFSVPPIAKHSCMQYVDGMHATTDLYCAINFISVIEALRSVVFIVVKSQSDKFISMIEALNVDCVCTKLTTF